MSYSIAIQKRGERNFYMRIRPHDQVKKINIPLGAINQKIAEKIRGNVDQLLRAYEFSDYTPPASTMQWVKEQSAELQARLAAAGLIPGRTPGQKLETYLKDYIASHNVKDSTAEQLNVVMRLLCSFFGKDRDVSTITLQDARAFRTELLRNGSGGGKPMAENTVRRYLGRARQMFGGLGDQNAFKDRSLPVAVGHDESKDFFVGVELISDVLDCAGSDEWRAAIALARFGGFRACEIPALDWSDIDWQRSAIKIDSPKTGLRTLPLFSELRPYLEAWYQASGGIGRVVQSYESSKSSLDAMRTQLGKIVDRSGNARWPRIWQNLRATRETELLSLGYPLKSVTKWLGNSKAVAMKHYVMPLESDFQRAAGVVSSVSTSVSEKTGQKRRTAENSDKLNRNLPVNEKIRCGKTADSLTKVTRLGCDRPHKSGDSEGFDLQVVSDSVGQQRTAPDEGTDYWSKLEEAVDGCCRAFQARRMRVSDLRDAIDILSNVPPESLEAAVRLVKANGWWALNPTERV